MERSCDSSKSDIALEVHCVSKQLGGRSVLRDVSFNCHKGEICGIIGHNGSGKTVLFKCICGLYHPDEGEIVLNNISQDKEDGKNNLSDHIGIIIDSPAFLSGKTGMQNLEFLYMLNHKKDRKHLENMLNQVGLEPSSKKKVKHYSLGMRQRLAIAQALMEDPELLILDEPMNGLDRNGIQDIREVLLNCKSRGKTILLASHNRDDIEILCDHVYEMEMGTLQQLK